MAEVGRKKEAPILFGSSRYAKKMARL